MVLADRLKQLLLHLESYLVKEKEYEVGHCYVCSWLFFMSVH